MWTAWIVFGLLWVGFAWMSVSPRDLSDAFPFEIRVPVFQQTCSTKPVPCVDDCSFLCVERTAKCVGGVCAVDSNQPLDCDTQKGGIPMLSQYPVPTWKCLCTDESIWSGPACNTLSPDVCENGTILYRSRDSIGCLCPKPYKKFLVNRKWHCLDRHVTNFFKSPAAGLVEERIGPSAR